MRWFVVVFALCLSSFVEADLPIHCTLRDVAGEWTFHLGPGQPIQNRLPGCGHSTPNTVESMLAIDRAKVVNSSEEETLTVSLTEEIVESGEDVRYLRAATADGGGKADMWTMVFDTGMEVRVGQRSFVAHFLFETLQGSEGAAATGDNWQDIGQYHGRKDGGLQPEGGTYACHCDATSTGWWHRRLEDGSLEGGCLWGEKKQPHLATPSASALVRLRPATAGRNPFAASSSNVSAGFNGFAAQADAVMKEDAQRNGPWKEVIRPFGAATSDRKAQATPSVPVPQTVSLRGVKAHRGASARAAKTELPKTFDWRKELSDIAPPGEDPLGRQIDQGSCGSCYAFAGTMMLQMRFRAQLFRKHGILYPLELSYKSVARCSPYTEGCSGGFSYFTSRLSYEIGVPLAAACDNDFPANQLDKACDWKCYNSSTLFYAKDYWHVGGFSGGSDEESIMREIYMNGPVELGFSTSAIPEFIVLNGNSNENSTDVMTVINNEKTLRERYSSNPEIRQWWYSTHAIIGVGWGEEEVPWGLVKYWIVRNSWGRTWGQGGYAKMRRGNNDGGIETDASMAVPDMDRLPPGFLEKAKEYHNAQESKRAEWRAQASDSPLREVASQPGTSTYCKNRPDSVDCQ